jgi:hypothetical protein
MTVPSAIRNRAAWLRLRLTTSVVGLALVAAACEDEGNPGNDNLLTGASLIVVVAIVVVVVLAMRRRSG